MSFNMSVGGLGNQPGADRPAPVEPAIKTKAEGANLDAVLLIPSTINNTQELRQAELSGENVTISDAQLVKAIEHAIKAVQGKTTSLEFSIHQKTKLISVKVLDKDTGEVIREIPPEKSLDFVAKLWEMAGILVDERR
ncbi:flagellar protein FlaG [Paenibacillus athensensis]|uniref:Flagellar biosynthesis protein FlaG n=1 Tax=Paenibacillus athensensis TaxID=1967502 RepID=A0A4Y8Q5S0_9BACL|nr:flagellar protein FlaG [Paenibacillus athensensis]